MRFLSRSLIDVALPMILSMALIAIYWLDTSAIQISARDSRGGLLNLIDDPTRNRAQTDIEQNQQSEKHHENTRPEKPGLTSSDPVLPEALELPRGNLGNRSEFVMGTQTEPDPERLRTFLKREVSVSTIPATPPPLLQTLERPKQIEQVRFFKLEAEAKSVVFLVDASGSMAGDPFERAQAELARAVGELNPYQTFSVAFFNHGYLFMPPVTGKRNSLNKATSETKSKAIAWMQSLIANGGTEPESAIREAAQLLIDSSHVDSKVIFLLTDGQFRPLSHDTFQLLQKHNISVFTIGFDLSDAPGNLESIAIQTGGQFRSAMASEAPHAMFLASSRSVLASLDDRDPDQRLAATIVAFSREMTYVRKSKSNQETHRPSNMELRFARKIPEMLKDPNDRVRREVHHRLVLKAMGSNFGPVDFDDQADTALAVRRWTLWSSDFFEQDQSHVVQALSSADASEQWAAASVIRIAGWDIPDELIANLGRVSLEARREIRAALQALTDGDDFGPDPDANDEQVARAVEKWTSWRTAAKERLEQERLAKLQKEEQERLAKFQKTAAEKLRVGDMHWKAGRAESKEKARTLWKKLIQEFPGTPAAGEAEQRLQQ